MHLYHISGECQARAILCSGFRDREVDCLMVQLRGVWLTDDPIAAELSACWDTDGLEPHKCLRVTLSASEAELHEFEWNRDDAEEPPIIGCNYREWLVPAEWLNAHTTSIDVVTDDSENELRSVLVKERKPIRSLESVVTGGAASHVVAKL